MICITTYNTNITFNILEHQVYKFGLFLVDKIMHDAGNSLMNLQDIPHFTGDWDDIVGNHLVAEQLDYDQLIELERASLYISKLNTCQKQVHDLILNSVQAKDSEGRQQGSLFFVNGPGGMGKLFTWNTLAHSCRGRGLIVLCVASSGIAAIIIGGTTAHNMFKIPIQVHEHSICAIKRGSERAHLLQKTSLIIWDEIPMQHHHLIEVVDRTCRDMLQCSHLPFGGITVAFGGDFQQTLPVVPRGNKEEIIGACIQRSPLWHHVNVLHLTKNMRIDPHDPQSTWFENWLYDIGQGNQLPLDHSLTDPQQMVCQPELSNLIPLTYPALQHGLEMSNGFFLENAILCPINTEVDDIN